MPESVKRDQARTRFARRAVVEAARTLFLERGYAATTMEAISEHSDVPAATVYRLFSSKLGILRALLDIDYDGYLSFEVMAPSGDPMGIPAGAGPESFDADTKQALDQLKAIEIEL